MKTIQNFLMADTTDLDDFFKKKDKKVRKVKKQSGILTNNEELLKQLVSVTSATSSYRDNLDFVDEDEETIYHDENNRPAVVEPSVTSSNTPKTAQPMKMKAADVNSDRFASANDQQQDEWEDFEGSNWKYDGIRDRLSRANANDDDIDEGDHSDDSMGRDENNHQNDQQEQQKDKPVWKLDQIKPNQSCEPSKPIEEVEATAPVQTKSSSYVPPHKRTGNSTIEVVSIGGSQAKPTGKKKQPNLASTEEFPTLGSNVAKK